MPELERELRSLGAQLAYPPTPDLAAAVRDRLQAPPRFRLWSRPLAVALAVAAVAIGAAFAVPQARTAILRFFGIGAVRIEFVDRLPEVQPGPLDLGRRIDLDEAPFHLLRSKLLGNPDATYLDGNAVTLLYGTRSHVRLLLTEIEGSGFESNVGKKLLAEGTRVKFVELRDVLSPGVWIEGKPHVVQFPGGPVRLAKNTLIWQRGDLTLRLEGKIRLAQASRIANSLR
jgi:hypothetical protein